LRLRAAGRREVDSQGYFDVQVVATGPSVKPPCSCFPDGLQVATGVTWGKRDIEWVEGDGLAFLAYAEAVFYLDLVTVC